MTETVEKFLFVLDVLDELGDVGFVADFDEHAEDSFVGSSVLWSVECTSAAGNHGVNINT